MAFSISTLVRTAFGPRPRLVCPANTWGAGVRELASRTNGSTRESGALLLGRCETPTRRVVEFMFYDDIDPSCLRNGIVELDGRRLGPVWTRCRETRLDVVADVHVHPAGYHQSASDKRNPIVAEPGHLALILPDFAKRRTRPGAIGIFEHLGGRRWADHTKAGDRFFHVGWWPEW